MTTAEKKRFAEVIHALALTFRVEGTRALYEAYWMGLDDLLLEGLEKAARRAMRECEFMPSVAELRRLAGKPVGGKAIPAYHRADLLETDMERVETCEFHRNDPRGTAPARVTWCRKCQRHLRAAKLAEELSGPAPAANLVAGILADLERDR